MKVSGLVIVAAVVAMLGACAEKPPACGDEKTISLVKQIYMNSVRKEASQRAPGESFIETIMVQAPVKLSLIRTQSVDEKVGKYSCDAEFEISLPERAGTLVNSPGFSALLGRAGNVEAVGRTLKSQIKFNSQLTADSKQHVVEVQGIGPIAFLMVALGSEGVLDAPKPAPQAAPASNTVTASSAPSATPEAPKDPVPAQAAQPAAPASVPPAAEVKPAPATVAPPATPAAAVMAIIAAARSGNNAAILPAKVALDAFPKPDRGDRKMARERNALGLKALNDNAHDIAVARFSEGVGFDQSDVEVRNNLGYALMMANKLEEAKKALVESLALDSSRGAAWANLGQTLAKQGDEDSAIGAFIVTFTFSRSQAKTIEFLRKLNESDPDAKVKAAAGKALEAPLIKDVAANTK